MRKIQVLQCSALHTGQALSSGTLDMKHMPEIMKDGGKCVCSPSAESVMNRDWRGRGRGGGAGVGRGGALPNESLV